MDDPIRVLVVDDHFVVRKGISVMLADAEGIAVVGEACDAKEAIAEARRLRPQVILMDLHLPDLDGIAATRAILAEQPRAAVVIVTGYTEDQTLAAFEAGALGYLFKTSRREEILEVIRRVAQGDTCLQPDLTHRLRTRWNPRPENTMEALSEREREVLSLIARGWSNRHISQSLSIAVVTVRTHVSHIFDKLGVHSRVEAALHAVRSNSAGQQGRRPALAGGRLVPAGSSPGEDQEP